MSEQNKKTALITGANRGIGFETARQLGQQGMRVLVGARSEENGREAEAKLKAEGFDADFVLLDVDDAQTHETAAQYVKENYGKLDVLINNAGIAIDELKNGAPVGASRTSKEIFRKTFDTNFFNTIAVTQAFVPLIKKSDAGRIVFLSSGLGSLSLHSDPNSPI